MKIKLTKGFILFVLLIVFILSGMSFETRILSETAIVIGLSVDYEDNQYVIGVQTVKAGSATAGESGTSDSYAITYAKAEMVSDAITSIGEKLGLIMTLAHCNVLIINEEALKYNMLELLECFEKGWYLPVRAVMVASEEKALDILSSATPTSEASSFFISLSLFQNQKFRMITPLSVKDFFVAYYSKSENATMAVIERQKLDKKKIIESQSSSIDYYDFYFDKNISVSPDGKIFSLSEEITNGFNLLYPSTVSKGKTLSLDTDDYKIEFAIVDKKSTAKFKDNTYVAKVKIQLSIMEYLDKKPEGDYVKKSIYTISNETKEQAKAEITKKAQEYAELLFEHIKATNNDCIFVKDLAYRSIGRSFAPKADFLSKVDYQAEIDLSLKDS